MSPGGDAWPAPEWNAAWYAPWRRVGAAVEERLAAGASLEEALNAPPDAPVRFVPQQALPRGIAYERFVFEHRQCPVRPALHDFFQGLAWLQWPRSKSALNRLQAEAIAREGVGARRGPVRDAITVFDENGALLHAPAALWEALELREWRRLFVDLRHLWQQARVLVFGHALLEQLARPRKNLTAHVWRADAPLAPGEDTDAWLAAQCTAERLETKPFTPLPVLGIPGWCAGNENFSFYDDSQVFRPRRTPQPTTTQNACEPLAPLKRVAATSSAARG